MVGTYRVNVTDSIIDDRPRPVWPGFELELEDRTTFVREAGREDGEPAVFIHGLGGSSTNWTDLMGELSDRLKCWAVDLPGFGHSPPPHDGDFSPRAHARGVASAIEKLSPGQPVHIFGNSLGGAVSVQLAARRPDLVRSVTLVSPALPELRPRRSNVHLPLMTLPGVGGFMLKKLSGIEAEKRAWGTISLCYADPKRFHPVRLQEAAAEVRRRDTLPYVGDAFVNSLKGLMATYFDRGPERPWELAKRINVPTLLVYGMQDQLVNPVSAFQVTDSFPDARVMVLPDSGHVAQMEHPEVVAEAWRGLGMTTGR